MASSRVEFNEKEYYRALNEYWRRVNESEGFDIEGIMGPSGLISNGQLVSYECEGLNCTNYPFEHKVKCYGQLGLHRYNLIRGTDFEQLSLVKFNMRAALTSCFFITLTARARAGARDPVTSSTPPIETFQVRVNENQCGCLNLVCSVARIKGEILDSPPRVTAAVPGTLPDWPSDVDIQQFYMVDRSDLPNTPWIRLYLWLLLCLRDERISEEKVSNVEFVKVAIDTDEETPLKARSSVLYIAFKGLAVDGTDESVERRAIIKSVFSELTGSLAIKGKLCEREGYVRMSAIETYHAYRRLMGIEGID